MVGKEYYDSRDAGAKEEELAVVLPDQDTLKRGFTTFLDFAAREYRGDVAFVDRDRVCSFTQLRDEASAVASGLVRIGIKPGDRVGLWLPNTTAWFVTFLACCRIGAVAVSINARFRSTELADILGRSRCKALLLWPDAEGINFREPYHQLPFDDLGDLRTIIAHDEGERAEIDGYDRTVIRYAELLKGPVATLPDAGNAPCIIFTTSGTTRAPKFVLHDQWTLLRHARDVVRSFSYDRDGAAILLTIPLYGVFGFCTALAALVAGRPVVTTPLFAPEEQAAQIARWKVTNFNAPIAVVERLFEETRNIGPQALDSLREIGFATFTTIPEDLTREAERRGIVLHGLYGSSELQALLARQPSEAEPSERLLGGGVLVAPEGRVRTVEPETGKVLDHGEPGELEFSVPSCMLGYAGDPEATAAATTADGYFRSGDLGYTISPTRFVYLSRIGDVLRLGGYLVSPAEIEHVVEQMPAVAEAQVVSVDRDGAPRPVAFVIARAGQVPDEAEVIAFCASRLAKFKVPIRVFTVDAFPTTLGPNGTKVQRNALQRQAQERLMDVSP